MEKVLTFIISNPNNAQFTTDLYENCRNFVNDANVVVLHEFNHFYDCIFERANDDFTFRLLVHSGSADKGGVMNSGEVIYQEIKGKVEFANVEVSFVTRKPDWFEKDQYSIEREGEKYWNMKYFNSSKAIQEFINDTKPIRKGDLKIDTANGNSSTDAKPKIFIGSSIDGLEYATAIKGVFENNPNYDVDVWVDVFGNGNSTNIEVLEGCIDQYKYSIFVFSPADTIKMSHNAEELIIPRDNCIFEYGLFMGKNGRPNTFFIVPNDWTGLRIISDLDGMNRFSYIVDNENKQSAVRTSCTKILEKIKGK